MSGSDIRTERLEHRAADVLVDDRRAHVGHRPDLIDAGGEVHHGLFEKGLPVLGAARETLPALPAQAFAAGVGVIDIPAVGQETNDYDEVRAHVAGTATADLEYLGLALHGPRRAVNRVTGTLLLLGRPSRSASRAA